MRDPRFSHTDPLPADNVLLGRRGYVFEDPELRPTHSLWRSPVRLRALLFAGLLTQAPGGLAPLAGRTRPARQAGSADPMRRRMAGSVSVVWSADLTKGQPSG
jgi:hypothetical protein